MKTARMRCGEIAPALRASQFHTVHPIQINIDPHPLLRIAVFSTSFPVPLGELSTPPALSDALRLDAPAPLQRDEAVRGAVRDLLRHGGYKPTGRGKPASEYLVRAATEGALGSINAAVDACNVVSLHSGFPISVVDLDRATAPFRIGIADEGTSYVFNASGQEIDVTGLLCLFDADGACANAVRDSQRTKTRAETRSTLGVVWGCAGFEQRLAIAERWYRALLGTLGATTTDAVVSPTGAVA
jgi:DNA/RNA-binding domain of Phe-tRNA-synthetase-like protein